MALNNAGTVDVKAGVFELDGGGTSSGTFNIASGSMLALGGNAYSITSTGTINKSGTLASLPGSVITNFGGFYNETGGDIVIGGGTFNVDAPLTTSALHLSTGTLGGSSRVTLAAGGSAILGNGNLKVSTFNVDTGATVAIANDTNTFFQPVTFNNAGTVLLTGVGLRTASGTTTFNNLPGAQFILQNTPTWDSCCSGGAVIFNNQAGATLTKMGAGTSSLTFAGSFNNSGPLDVISGHLTSRRRRASGGRWARAATVAGAAPLEDAARGVRQGAVRGAERRAAGNVDRSLV